MFTGIIETEGEVIELSNEHDSLLLKVKSSLAPELKIDQSVAHNGICLTVIAIEGDIHQVCAVGDTIQKTTIGNWKPGDHINLERCMKLNDRLDGHIVQGHVDTKAICIDKKDVENNWVYRFEIPKGYNHLIIEKGSVCINGTSLTCFNVTGNSFEVAIIPYTYYHTSIRNVQNDQHVNIEFDVIGKYIARMQDVKNRQ